MAAEITVARESKANPLNSLRAGNGWRRSDYGELHKYAGRGYARITASDNGKVRLDLRYDGYSGGVGDFIENLSPSEARKRGNEFLKNPHKYFYG